MSLSSSSAASSDSLPASCPGSAASAGAATGTGSLSREGSLLMKRGASVSALALGAGDAAQPSGDVQPADANAEGDASAALRSEAEGGQLADAMADFKSADFNKTVG